MKKTAFLFLLVFLSFALSNAAEKKQVKKNTSDTSSGINILPDSSFEEMPTATEYYPMLGEYRLPENPEWNLDITEHFHGKKSLCIRGTNPYIWQVLNKPSTDCVFSVYLKAEHGGEKVEIGIEPVFFHLQGGLNTVTERKEILLDKEWKRFEISCSHDKKKMQEASPTQELYRAWVKAAGKGKIWIDAAQLETGKTTASNYDPDRTGNNKAPVIRCPVVTEQSELPDFSGKKSKSGSIKIKIKDLKKTDRKNEPVWGGIPFPKGELFDENSIKIFNTEGKEIPSQTKALARRHIDGSITSLLVDIQTDISNEQERKYTLKYGIGGNATNKTIASENADEITVNTGAVSATIKKNSFRIFDILQNKQGEKIEALPLSSGSYVKAPDGTVYSSEALKPEKIRIESNGPLHAVIYARGKHGNNNEKILLDYEIRIHAFADKPYFMIEAAFENCEQQYNTAVKSIFLRLPIKPGNSCEFNVTEGNNIKTNLSEKGTISVAQLHEYYGNGNYESVLQNDGKLSRFANLKLDGTAKNGNSTISVQNFWQLNPKAISISSNSAGIYYWPEHNVKAPDLPFGISSSITLSYSPFENKENGESLVQSPLILQADPEWVAQSGVFGKYLTAKTAKEKYPRYEKIVEKYFSELLLHPVICDLTGILDYGDLGSFQKRVNNETAINESLWLQYLSTMEPSLFFQAVAQAKHQRESDTTHIGKDAACLNTHSGGVHTSFHFHTGHFWISALIWHYLLTGDMRSYDTARRLGAELILKHKLSHYKGRERARMLLHLAELYDLTHLKCFREAYETHYNFGQATPDKGNYYIGIGLLALKRWYDTTGEEKYLERFKTDAEKILLVPPQEDIQGNNGFAVEGGRGWYLFSALAEATRVTNNPEFIKKYQDQFLWHMLKLTSSDACMVMGAEFLEAADKFEIKENPFMPENLLGIEQMTGYQRGAPS
ncbi:MAG: hypothetical protein UT30_C0036G0004, partial [Candidatus Uhrbacteria bacterium GW2011_GWF2_39_13]